MSKCCADGNGKTVLFYACSGGANVGEVADRAARQMMYDGHGDMFCLAGLGGGVQGMIQTAKDADLNVVIDGCDMDCAKKCFEQAGVSNYVQVKVTDLGIEKAKPKAATDEQVAAVTAQVKRVLAEAEGRPATVAAVIAEVKRVLGEASE